MRWLVLSCLLYVAAGFDSCYDGAVFGPSDQPASCSNFIPRRSSSPTIQIDGYKHDWELNNDGTVSVNMLMGFTVTAGLAQGGFKSITDNAHSVTVEQLAVIAPDGTPMGHETYIDEGSYRMLKWFFPGDGLRPEDGTFDVLVTYRLRSAACKNLLEEREEYSARWANIWRVPVNNIEYSFTLPTGEWGAGSPMIIEPSKLLSSPTYTTPAGKGPRVAYAFTSNELMIGRSPNAIAFGWTRLAGESNLEECFGAAEAGLLFLLFLLLLLPCFCICAFFACKKKPPPVNTGGGGYGGGYNPNQNNYGYAPGGYNQGPMYATAVQDSSGIPSAQPLPGQGFVPMAQNAEPSAPVHIPVATPADAPPPPYEVAANMPPTAAGKQW